MAAAQGGVSLQFELASAESWASSPVISSGSGVGKYVLFALVANSVTAAMFAIGFIVLNVRFFKRSMSQKISPNEIIKRFDQSGAKHLSLGQEGIDNGLLVEHFEERKSFLTAEQQR